MNRLKLDWSLTSHEERNDFINKYIKDPIFDKIPPTSDELETMANYVLWGRDKDGETLEQKGELNLPRKSDNWTKSTSDRVKSLDELMENPSWNENEIITTEHVPTKVPRVVFSREEARAKAPASLLSELEELWKLIDRTELTISYYELAHGKRIKPIRDELLAAVPEDERIEMELSAAGMPQFRYLKLRHQLVELRQQQYVYRDSYITPITVDPTTITHNISNPSPTFGDEIYILPLGLSIYNPQVFHPLSYYNPKKMTEDALKQINDAVWKFERTKKEISKSANIFYFDFRELKHVYELLNTYETMNEEEDKIDKTNKALIETLKYYIEEADLTEVQREILLLKLEKRKNQDIAATINEKYGKAYTTNYISTIFCQKIIPAINDAAKLHQRIIENIFFPDEFKPCIECGRVYLRDTTYFVRKSKAKDGLSNRCKCCDKKDRDFKKMVAEKAKEVKCVEGKQK